ncbi:hypothetical protein TM49_17540 [Martelella endophytica]|uniref:Uncharacterized protein n=1 Tax=Martelella endophytica TaxID=1486262 RepID=A0A0D5LSK3_MAREN|nr:hypothetical protein TM49_17540 [Martelella endophytica]
MAQFSLFGEAAAESFSLPALNYGPVKMAIGQIRAQFRPAAEIALIPDGQIRISPRTLVPASSTNVAS